MINFTCTFPTYQKWNGTTIGTVMEWKQNDLKMPFLNNWWNRRTIVQQRRNIKSRLKCASVKLCLTPFTVGRQLPKDITDAVYACATTLMLQCLITKSGQHLEKGKQDYHWKGIKAEDYCVIFANQGGTYHRMYTHKTYTCKHTHTCITHATHT